MVESLVRVVFIVAVLVSTAGLLSYVVLGFLLARKLRRQMPELMEKLDNPWGLSTPLMRNTSLYDDYLKLKLHESNSSPAIRSLGKRAIFAKNSYHYASAVCMICLLSLLVLERI